MRVVIAEDLALLRATLVFLCAVSEEAGSVYQRVGFRPCATLVEYTRK